MVTHDPDLAKKHAKTIYSIRDGKVEYIDPNLFIDHNIKKAERP